MRIVVYPATMEMGGSTVNALELAARVQARGHEVVVYGDDDVLVDMAGSLGLEWVAAAPRRGWPSHTDVRRLTRMVREREVDVLHAYEGGPALDAAFVGALVPRVAQVTTVMSMSVPYDLPRAADLFVGTHELWEQQRALRPRVRLMEPPIDTEANRPKDPVGARQRMGVAPGATCLAVVCRLTDDLGKLPGVLDAVRAVDGLVAAGHELQLLVAGGGEGLGALRAAAASVNARHGRDVVLAPGPLLDPRDAYDAAHLALGMGSSALRAMSFGTPLVVQGDRGFWRLFDHASAPDFARTGMYGVGGAGVADLTAILLGLLADRATWSDLGARGRTVVEERYSLDAATDLLLEAYAAALADPHPPSVLRREAARTAGELAKCRVAQWDERRGGALRRLSRRVRGVAR